MSEGFISIYKVSKQFRKQIIQSSDGGIKIPLA
jgi:hypothetical protein